MKEIWGIAVKNGLRPVAEEVRQTIALIFEKIREQKRFLQLLSKAGLEIFYLDCLRTWFTPVFEAHFGAGSGYMACHYVSSFFGISMKWVKEDCVETVDTLTDIYFNILFLPSVALRAKQ